MGRRRVTTEELLARAEANRYKKEEHKAEDKVRGGDNYVDKIKKDQGATLDRYVL
jgi:hypothetical protein